MLQRLYWLATDSSEKSFLFNKEPELIDEGYWEVREESGENQYIFAGYNVIPKNTCKQTLLAIV